MPKTTDATETTPTGGKKTYKVTRMATEAANADPGVDVARKGLALALFTGPAEQANVDMSNFVDKSLPLIIKPKDMTAGQGFIAKLVKVSKSPIAEFKNNILEFVTAKQQRFAFPDVATVHKALDDDPAKYIGHEIFVRYMGTKQGRDTSHKPARLFDVKVSKEPVTYEWEETAGKK